MDHPASLYTLGGAKEFIGVTAFEEQLRQAERIRLADLSQTADGW
jgi:hypothetical protein